MKKIYLSPPHMSGKELKYIKDVFKHFDMDASGDSINIDYFNVV